MGDYINMDYNKKQPKHWLTIALFHINVTCHMQVFDFVLGLTIQYYGPHHFPKQ